MAVHLLDLNHRNVSPQQVSVIVNQIMQVPSATNAHLDITDILIVNHVNAMRRAPQTLKNAMKNQDSVRVNQFIKDDSVIDVSQGSMVFPIVNHANVILQEHNLNKVKKM